jgi:hypothetical protein
MESLPKTEIDKIDCMQDYRSDCWNDVDESDFACAEKSRIELMLKPPGSENAVIDNYVPIFKPGQYKIRHLVSFS